jgi:hypothetical protein
MSLLLLHQYRSWPQAAAGLADAAPPVRGPRQLILMIYTRCCCFKKLQLQQLFLLLLLLNLHALQLLQLLHDVETL